MESVQQKFTLFNPDGHPAARHAVGRVPRVQDARRAAHRAEPQSADHTKRRVVRSAATRSTRIAAEEYGDPRRVAADRGRQQRRADDPRGSRRAPAAHPATRRHQRRHAGGGHAMTGDRDPRSTSGQDFYVPTFEVQAPTGAARPRCHPRHHAGHLQGQHRGDRQLRASRSTTGTPRAGLQVQRRRSLRSGQELELWMGYYGSDRCG